MNFLEKNLEDPVRFARIKKWFYRGLGIVVLAEIFLPPIFQWLLGHSHPPHFWFESFPSGEFFPKLPWGSIYGLVSCITIIIGSKFLGKIWLMRQEDYYDS